MAAVVLVDVDGTLVDSNYQHALTWFKAFRAHGMAVPVARIHRALGMGGDQLVAAVAGEQFDSEHGDAVRQTHSSLYGAEIGEVELLPAARELLGALRERGAVVVLASSAKEEELHRYLELLGGESVVDHWTSAADVEATKPHPELFEVALAKGGGGPAVVIGDSVWDVEAARRAGLPSACVTSGGFCAAELLEAGAASVHESLFAMNEELEDVLALADR